MPASLTPYQARLILNALPHIGPVLLKRLLEHFEGDPVALLAANPSELTAVHGVGKMIAATLNQWSSHFNLAREEGLLETTATRFISMDCADYPQLLRETYDPPIGLYWQGNYTLDRPCVAIVGTRKATLYGLSVAKRFAAELAKLGFCVVSGMARGTDTAAHEGALSVGGKTVAVQGCGLDIIYPPENIDLYKTLLSEGAVVSEFCFGRRADRQTFPMRNRVVAGMCEAVLVVESDRSGGSMITARFAGEQGRSLMAVPGRIDQASSAGCHQLLRDGAIMVTCVDDILEELRYHRPQAPDLNVASESPASQDSIALSNEEAALLQCFSGGAILSLDALTQQSGKSAAAVAALLMGLELKRQLVKRSDGCFELK